MEKTLEIPNFFMLEKANKTLLSYPAVSGTL